MKRPRHQSSRNLWLWIFVLISLIGSGLRTQGQTKPPRERENYSTKMSTQRSYYDPPNRDKVKMEISGDEMTNLPSGVLVTRAKINSYSLAGGAPQFTAETPQCILDTSTSQLSSTNILRARSGDGNFYVEGIGFLWQKTAPELTLSNRVHTIIRQFIGGGAGTNKTPSETKVDSEHATFDKDGAVVVYHDNVRVVDPQLYLTCTLLTAHMSQGETNRQLDSIIAETHVIMDFADESGHKIHATSDKAVYRRETAPVTNELLTLSGNPRLETSNGWSTADTFVMNRTTGKIHGNGNCDFHSRAALAATTGAAPTGLPPGTRITAESFDYDPKTGIIVYRGNVRAVNPQLALVCETLTVKSAEGKAKGSEFDNIVAENSVAIDYLDERGEKTHATCEKAVYSSKVANGVTNKVLNLTGNPVLERTDGWVMADLISMDTEKRIIRGEGNTHSIFKKQPGKISQKGPSAESDTEIFSDYFDYNINTGLAFYRGDARVLDPEIRLQSRQLTIKLPSDAGTNRAGRPERIVAETNVIVDYFTQKGEKTHATGDKMVFTSTITNGPATNQVLELTGSPVIDMTKTNGAVTHATGDKIVYTSTLVEGKPSELVQLSGHPHVEGAQGAMSSDDVIIYDRATGEIRSHSAGQNHIVIPIKPQTPTPTNSPPALSEAPAP